MFGQINRVAVCLSGQARTWRTAKENILKYFDLTEAGIQVDYFIHTWDINQYRRKDHITWLDREDEKVLPTEKEDLIKAFNPITIELEEYRKEDYVSLWAALLYSFMKSVWLKRQHEIENDFRYDLVIRARTDINYFQEGICNLHFPHNKFYAHPVQHLTGYSTMPILNRFATEFNAPCFDDVFFYSNSTTMDIISNCYRWYTDIVKTGDEQHPAYRYGPGTILYRYLVERGIHPQGYRSILYYVVRKDVEEYGLHSLDNWKDIRDFSHEWYASILHSKQEKSVLDKYKYKSLI